MLVLWSQNLALCIEHKTCGKFTTLDFSFAMATSSDSKARSVFPYIVCKDFMLKFL